VSHTIESVATADAGRSFEVAVTPCNDALMPFNTGDPVTLAVYIPGGGAAGFVTAKKAHA
jgi:hypothetical protein